MAKIDLKFLDVYDTSVSNYIKVDVYDIDSIEKPETETQQIVRIKAFDSDGYVLIYFDKSTAIKFAKTLRTEINKIKD